MDKPVKQMPGEEVMKVFYHHPFKFFLQVISTVIVSIPFFYVASFFYEVLNANVMLIIYSAIIFLFVVVIAYQAFVFFKDRLVITNYKIIHEDWKTPFKYHESEIALKDILDVSTQEKGLLQLIPLFDYGVINIETAADAAGIMFQDATDPEGIKHFIYHLQLKPSKILSDTTVTNAGFTYDRTVGEKKERPHSS